MSDQPIIVEEFPVEQQTTTEQKFVDEVKIGDQTIFTIPLTMQFEQNYLAPKQRKTRWGQFIIRKQKIHEDVVFNPLEALVCGTSLLPITQYGQSELQIKMALFSDPNNRRKSKWHHQIQRTFTPPMMNYISPQISLDEVEYLIRLARLDQLTSKMSDFTPDDPDVRSPSPEPIYDRTGKRVNTREVRKRDQLLKQRVTIIQDCMKMRKSFVPPKDYKPLKKYKKIYLSDTAMNDTHANYMGKIIGTGGSTQKMIEQRSGCKIAIRGRGANNYHKDIYENYERLHVLITADSEQQLEKGVSEIQKILNGMEDPELKAAQQRQLMLMQGIFSDNYCDNCHQQGHRTWACPHDATHTRNMIKCAICNEISHITSDCPQKAEFKKQQQTAANNMLLESQYSKFKSEMDEKEKPKQITGGLAFITDFSKKDLLAIENKKEFLGVPTVASGVLGGFPTPVAIQKGKQKADGLGFSFPMPKFEEPEKK